MGFSLRGLLSLCSAGSRAHTSVVVAPGLQSAGSALVGMGLVALRPVGSSRAGHGTRVPALARVPSFPPALGHFLLKVMGKDHLSIVREPLPRRQPSAFACSQHAHSQKELEKLRGPTSPALRLRTISSSRRRTSSSPLLSTRVLSPDSANTGQVSGTDVPLPTPEQQTPPPLPA